MDDLSDADLAAAQPSALVKLAAAAQALTGVLVALSGLQIVDLHFVRYPILGALPYVLMAGGVALLVLATRVYRTRAWAAFVAGGLAPLLALILLAWGFYSFTSVFSCIMLVAVPLSLLTSIFGLVAIGAVRKAAAARERLADQGIGLGL